MASSSTSALLVGRPTITMCLRVPADREQEVDEFFAGHEAWMRTAHKMGEDGDGDAISLLEFYISKGKEMKDPMDPSKGDTGNFLFVMSETYAAKEGIATHMERGGKDWEGMAKLPEYLAEMAVFVQIGACSILTCYEDAPAPMMTSKGQPCIHAAWVVEADKETEMDAYWKDHEQFMRNYHTMGTEGDDSEKARLTSFYIAKGPEMNDPMDPSKGVTGKVVYVMSETYAAPEGIAKHMELGGANWPGMAKFGAMTADCGVFLEAGSSAVVTNLFD